MSDAVKIIQALNHLERAKKFVSRAAERIGWVDGLSREFARIEAMEIKIEILWHQVNNAARNKHLRELKAQKPKAVKS